MGNFEMYKHEAIWIYPIFDFKKIEKKVALVETIKGKGIWECPESQNSGFQEKEEHKSKETNK